jgi:hypothetical protein
MSGELRRLTADLYGLRGWFRGGRCVDHLPRGSEFMIAENSQGETCIFAYGREYPVDHAVRYDAMSKSKPV